jgi:hypothetical protein
MKKVGVNTILYTILFTEELHYSFTSRMALCQDLALLIAVSATDLLLFSSSQYFITLRESAFYCHTNRVAFVFIDQE